MTDFALGTIRSGRAVSAPRRSLGVVRPSSPSPPTLMRWRREKEVWWKSLQAKVWRMSCSGVRGLTTKTRRHEGQLVLGHRTAIKPIRVHFKIVLRELAQTDRGALVPLC